MATALYPGSFDPVTNGHLDVIERAARVFERVVVGVLVNPRKSPLFDDATRVTVLREAIAAALPPAATARVEVATFDGLTVAFASHVGAAFVVRGLRAISDFDFELQLALTNRKLAPEIDSVFFMTALEHAYLSSTLVKEIAGFGGDVSGMVPPAVMRRLGGASPVG
ncbi:MAG: pantetheine-phosphate adenylyltransferase [Candidatus Limnocylindrales bacterium]